MKKILVIILLIIALPLYGYNLYLLLRTAFPAAERTQTATDERSIPYKQLLATLVPVRFGDTGRDPFTLYKEPPKAALVHPVVKPAAGLAPVSPPPITISGILWNPANPVVMVKIAGGTTILAKTGQQLGANLSVKRITQKSVVVLFEGKEFTIEKK